MQSVVIDTLKGKKAWWELSAVVELLPQNQPLVWACNKQS